jgi:transcriptional regulator with XRE-family HTH domain
MRPLIFEILRQCGITQSEIATRLGIARSSVSMWATGVRPIPAKHEVTLLQWAKDATATAVEQARALDAASPRTTVLMDHWHENRLLHDLELLLHDYHWQMEEAESHGLTGHLVATLRRWAHAYDDADPATLTLKPAELDRLWEDTKKIRGIISTLRRLAASEDAPAPAEQEGERHA